MTHVLSATRGDYVLVKSADDSFNYVATLDLHRRTTPTEDAYLAGAPIVTDSSISADGIELTITFSHPVAPSALTFDGLSVSVDSVAATVTDLRFEFGKLIVSLDSAVPAEALVEFEFESVTLKSQLNNVAVASDSYEVVTNNSTVGT
jgi:hypothetical protein